MIAQVMGCAQGQMSQRACGDPLRRNGPHLGHPEASIVFRTEAQGNLGEILVNKVIAKLTNDIVARGLPIEELHERWPDLCCVNKALVCWLTEFQNSFSATSPDANPSASKASSSSGVPANPGESPLFHGGQGGLDHLLHGLVSATTQQRLKSALLLRSKVDGHGVCSLPTIQVKRKSAR
jgi:hypothetical protein